MPRVTIYTIAKELNMTPSMVSRALNPKGRVDEKKRELVLKTAEKYNFTKNCFASRLSARPKKIGVLINSAFDPVAKKMTDGIKSAYEKVKDYKVTYEIKVVKKSIKNPWDCEDELFSFSDFDGVIVSGFGSDKCTDMLQRFIKLNPNLVQMQSINENVPCLFSSRHSEKTASDLAAEFLYNCLRRGRKNVLLFTGDKLNSLHRRAEEAFINATEKYGLNVLDSFDMKDSDASLRALLPSVFEKYKDKIDGIYITSGNSLALCEYVKQNNLPVSLLTFDTYKELNEYLKDGTVSMTVSQNVKKQAENAFLILTDYLVSGKIPEKTVLSEVRPIMKSIL